MEAFIIYNDDGWSSYMRYPAPMTPEEILAVTVVPVTATGVRVFQFCSLGGHAVNYSSSFLPRVGESMGAIDTMHVWRMRETLRSLSEQGTDPLQIVSDGCHGHNLRCQFSLRMNDAHHTYKRRDGNWYFPELLSPWFDAHADALLPNRQLDYAHPDVHEYRVAQIREVLDKYDVDGIDLDFTRFKPWFRAGAEQAGMPRMTELMGRLRELVSSKGKTLSARFEYDPAMSAAGGLDVERWLQDGLLDQVTLGGVAAHNPDAPVRWWVEHARARGAKVCPGFEGITDWYPATGWGGAGLHPGTAVEDGYGPPSMPYLRAAAMLAYADGADGISLFNFSCTDGPFPRDAFVELADPEHMRFRDKQYVMTLWPWDAFPVQSEWVSSFALPPGSMRGARTFRLVDDVAGASRRGYAVRAALTVELKGVNEISDVELGLNGARLPWSGTLYNHWDHGCWNDILGFVVDPATLREGENLLELERAREYPGFAGNLELRKCVLAVSYDRDFTPGRIARAKPTAG